MGEVWHQVASGRGVDCRDAASIGGFYVNTGVRLLPFGDSDRRQDAIQPDYLQRLTQCRWITA
jgi:hypothetical protein